MPPSAGDSCTSGWPVDGDVASSIGRCVAPGRGGNAQARANPFLTRCRKIAATEASPAVDGKIKMKRRTQPLTSILFAKPTVHTLWRAVVRRWVCFREASNGGAAGANGAREVTTSTERHPQRSPFLPLPSPIPLSPRPCLHNVREVTQTLHRDGSTRCMVGKVGQAESLSVESPRMQEPVLGFFVLRKNKWNPFVMPRGRRNSRRACVDGMVIIVGSTT
ncbi:hypothetical protein M433DRAFT_196199 [Acidomyces richmondensis BFW]|nr:hypothetical protein M433DRAFT_196199 [Acidomyces richmondensis BFW]